MGQGRTEAAGRALQALGAPAEALRALQAEAQGARTAAEASTTWQLLQTPAVRAELKLGAHLHTSAADDNIIPLRPVGFVHCAMLQGTSASGGHSKVFFHQALQSFLRDGSSVRFDQCQSLGCHH